MVFQQTECFDIGFLIQIVFREKEGRFLFFPGRKDCLLFSYMANVPSDFRMLLWQDNDRAALKMLMVMETVAM